MPVDVMPMKMRPSKRASRWRRACSQVCSSKSTCRYYRERSLCAWTTYIEVRFQPERAPTLGIFLANRLMSESTMKSKLLFGLASAAISFFLTSSAYAGGPGHTRYRIVNLGDPQGGPISQGTSNNQPGWIAGLSLRPDATMQAELWRNGTARSLGTLGGPNSAVAWPNRNEHGVIVGISETAQLQPLGENWSCYLAVFFVSSNHVCRGFVWRNGAMSALPTLGGDNGFATGVNNRGQIVGWAENNTHDPTCNEFTNTGQVLQFEAAMWVWDQGRQRYRAVALPPYPGDLDGAATAINQWGAAVGITGICDAAIGGGTAEHMVVWRDGRFLRSLPTLGGAYWNTPMDINNLGNVAGFSDLPGDGPTFAGANFHAFFWSLRPYNCNGKKVRGTCDLGTLDPQGRSEALGINDQDQVVGVSLPSTHAFLWQDGTMTDLNKLVVPGTTLTLTIAQDINDRGEITGQATDPGTGATVAFEAIPVN
jgi:probable HAF family extracellular repeat protein